MCEKKISQWKKCQIKLKGILGSMALKNPPTFLGALLGLIHESNIVTY
jgi:hypothetical protein